MVTPGAATAPPPPLLVPPPVPRETHWLGSLAGVAWEAGRGWGQGEPVQGLQASEQWGECKEQPLSWDAKRHTEYCLAEKKRLENRGHDDS